MKRANKATRELIRTIATEPGGRYDASMALALQYAAEAVLEGRAGDLEQARACARLCTSMGLRSASARAQRLKDLGTEPAEDPVDDRIGANGEHE